MVSRSVTPDMTRNPAQNGQPVPVERLFTVAHHSPVRSRSWGPSSCSTIQFMLTLVTTVQSTIITASWSCMGPVDGVFSSRDADGAEDGGS